METKKQTPENSYETLMSSKTEFQLHFFYPISFGSVTLIKRNNPGLVSG